MSTDALRIALLTHSVNPRGGVVHTLELASALSAQGHDVTVFAPATNGETLFRTPPCRVVYAPVTDSQAGTVALVDARIRALKRSVRAHGPTAFDVLHAEDSISGNALAELKGEGVIRGFVRTVHHLDHFDDPRLAAWQVRAYRDADQVFCVSDTWSREMLARDGIAAVTVSNGVDTARYTSQALPADEALRQRLGLGAGPLILAVGGVEARKNTLALLDAFALVRRALPLAQLVIAGGASLLDHNAYTQRFIRCAAQHGLSIGPHESIVVTGPLEDPAMPALFRSADVLAMVSVREGFGLVVLEALACGTPVVASAIAPFTEYLDDATCFWATPTDAHSIAAALLCAIRGDSATDFADAVSALLARFSWEASARRHVDAYRAWLAHQPLAIHQAISKRGFSMPVMHFRIQWPDGDEANCYSPSQVVSEFFTPGHAYPLDDFVRRSREALNIASERVRQKYGFACSAAMDQLAQIEREAERFRNRPDATVKVVELL